MITTGIFFLFKRWILLPLKDHWRIILPIAGVLVLAVVLFRYYGKPSPKFDEQQIQKAQTAIAKQDREEMVKILAESDVKEQGLDDTIKSAENATEEAKKNYTGLSNDDLAAELERRANP